MCGMATVTTPEAMAAATPGTEIFQGHAVVQAKFRVLLLQELNGRQIGLRVRLALCDRVPRDEEFEVGLRQARNDLPGQRGLGHGDEGAADTGLVQLIEQFAGTGAPRNGVPDLADHMDGEGVDDVAPFHRHAGFLQDARGKRQGLSTSCNAWSWDHCPPWASTRARSASIQ